MGAGGRGREDTAALSQLFGDLSSSHKRVRPVLSLRGAGGVTGLLALTHTPLPPRPFVSVFACAPFMK